VAWAFTSASDSFIKETNPSARDPIADLFFLPLFRPANPRISSSRLSRADLTLRAATSSGGQVLRSTFVNRFCGDFVVRPRRCPSPEGRIGFGGGRGARHCSKLCFLLTEQRSGIDLLAVGLRFVLLHRRWTRKRIHWNRHHLEELDMIVE
jgi:hypothetical protein